MRSLCLLPHGIFSFLPAVTATAGAVLSVLSLLSCNFATRAVMANEVELGDLRIGIWGYSVEGTMIASGDECFKYASDDTDMYIDCVKVLGLIAIALGGIVAVSWYVLKWLKRSLL